MFCRILPLEIAALVNPMFCTAISIKFQWQMLHSTFYYSPLYPLYVYVSLSVTICQRVRPVLAMDSKSINVSNVIHVDIGCDVRFL
jgi:hypothetical protein